jgi:hypothetical protein
LTSTPVPSSGQTTTAPTTSDSAAPTVTTASTTTDSGSQKTLPFTGIDLWAVAGIGLTFTASGLLIRIRARA